MEGKQWLTPVFGHSGPVAFAVEMIQAVFHPMDVDNATPVPVEAETAARVDARIIELFDL